MIGFAITDRAVWRCGVTLNNFATRSSLIIPILLCWVLLNERKPSWIALALVFVALLLIILPNRQQQHAPSLKQSASDKIRNRKSMLSLIGVFTFAGFGDFMIKVMQKSAATDGVSATNIFDPHYLVLLSIVFGSGALASFIYCLATKHIPLKYDPFRAPITIRMTYGFLLGVSNVGCTASIVLALTQVSTSIFYAIYNIGIVLVSTIIGITIFKEHVNILQALGIVIGIAAILFMVWL
ncbi:MAG: hypothetical protein KBT04_07265 [Bacteroidales bacterium]|nr:hypothetical protein [Candidatus Colimorpha onthohippi]